MLRIQRNILLKNHTTFKIGGPAEYFSAIRSREDLVYAINFAKKNKLDIIVLGEGSNLLVSDKGFWGLAVKMKNTAMKAEKNEVFAQAGASLEDFVDFCKNNNFSGMEWAGGIPGTVGGAIYGNAQAFGAKISDCLKSVEALDIKTSKFRNFSKKQCRFLLKNSIFKASKNLIIVSALFQLPKGDKKEIEKKIKEYLDYRKSRHPLNFPSAGSVFVNPEIKIKNKSLLEKFPELNDFNKRGSIHAGYLIEKAGLKGKKIGKAQISERHANFIINKGGARARDVEGLIKLARKKVKKIFGIELAEEIQQIGF
ncbi:MAG: UDP-N-acetylmuramate dehydrogenase [Candidatus Staskawiczbacteria bacterium]|nr:UDP-N-acetylmuramate dehydrogenase [Candidatus Staskawiczbacteria bacterium]